MGVAARTLSSVLALVAGAIGANAAAPLTGVNLSVAEFGTAGGFAALPGNYNQHYRYPGTDEVDYYVDKGVNIFRLPFRWERLQRSQFATLDATEFSRMDTFVQHATDQGAYVALDPHNFARYYPDLSDFGSMQSGSQGVIGSASVPNTAFADFWGKLADRYKDNDRVIFNLMNEPNAIGGQQWLSAANAAIAAIRNTGADNLILVPGVSWTGAHSWYSSGNATTMLGVVDPADNYAYDVHQYMDNNHSGGSPQIAGNNPDTGVDRVQAFTGWLKQHNKRGFLGEFAVANSRIGNGNGPDGPRIGDELIENLLDHLNENDDVWLGWAWWAGGPWWGDYQFTTHPQNFGGGNQTDRQSIDLLEPYFQGFAPDSLLGDMNGNGVVDAADYTLIRDFFNQSVAPFTNGDGNGDGQVDGADYQLWLDHFGETATAVAVPEPIGAALLAGLATLLVAMRSRLG